MKVVTILGSPKPKGKTAHVLDIFEKSLIIKGYEVKRFQISNHNIKGCMGCFSCMANNDGPGCVIKDDAISIFQEMISADAIIYASPIYCYDFTSQFKTLLDRHFCLSINFGYPNNTSSIAGKKTALLLTCMGTEEKNADIAKEIFDRSMKNVLKCNIVGEYVVSLSEFPDFNDRARKTAEKMVNEILK